MAVEVQEIDWSARTLVTSDQRSLPIVHLFDRLGRPLPGPFGAVLALAGAPGGWVTVKLCEYDRRALQ